MKETLLKVWNAIKDYVYIIVAVVIIRTFLVTPAIVSGASMDNTLNNNQIVIVNKIVYRIKDIKRFDIVVVNNEEYNDKIIKRVIGLPGEKIKYSIETNEDGTTKGVLYINGEVVEEEFLDEQTKKDTCYKDPAICTGEITIPNDAYFVMGDNRLRSADSRVFGLFRTKDILGRVKFRLTPISKIGIIDK